jgi:hypothetical protein
MDTRNTNRPLSSHTSSQRLYEDDHEEILRICRESGREPAEEICELVSEALRARRSLSAGAKEMLQTLQHLVEQNLRLIEQNRSANDRYERLLEKSETLEDRWDSLKRGLIQNLREFYAILLETLSASIGARNLSWNYVARVILDKSGFNEEQIGRRYEDEKKAWIEEREKIAEELERAVRRPLDQEAFMNGDLDDFDFDSRSRNLASHDKKG